MTPKKRKKVSYISAGEFARQLRDAGIVRSESTIRTWCNRGLPGAKKIGRSWDIDESTVDLVIDGKWHC
jgi:transposase-like protein